MSYGRDTYHLRLVKAVERTLEEGAFIIEFWPHLYAFYATRILDIEFYSLRWTVTKEVESNSSFEIMIANGAEAALPANLSRHITEISLPYVVMYKLAN